MVCEQVLDLLNRVERDKESLGVPRNEKGNANNNNVEDSQFRLNVELISIESNM